jgi:hypothetical protein
MDNTWGKTTYLAHLATLLDANMAYLHTTLNWAITILLGGVVFLASRSSFPDLISYDGALIMLVVLAHFAVRTSKAYLNVMRWSSIEKHILQATINNADEDWDIIKSNIIEYHCNWTSPLALKDVIWKVMFELGFFYLVSITILLIGYTLYHVQISYLTISHLAVAILFIIIEVWFGLLRSSYMRQVNPDPIAHSQR